MAQYAISEINEKRLLIDAAEIGWIKEHDPNTILGLTLSLGRNAASCLRMLS
jgi:hypothetical protein